MDFLYFVLLVGVLIFVHELGHFACAKTFGVRVLTFAVGFGPRVFSARLGETEYVVSLLPIGGYVKLLGEGPQDEVPESEREHAFGDQPLWKRLLIVFAGPAMNLLLPLVLFFVVALNDPWLPSPVIGTVVAGEPADGVLRPGDRLVAVDGDDVRSFSDFTRMVQNRPGRRLEISIERDGRPMTVTLRARRVEQDLELERSRIVGRLGVLRHHAVGVVGVPSESSAAGAAGLRTFDRVVAARGRSVDRYSDLTGVFGSRSLVPVTFLRPARLEGALGGLVELDLYEPHIATVSPSPSRGGGLLRVGLETADLYVSHVRVGSAGHRGGVLPGDRVVSFDGHPVRQWIELAMRVEDSDAGVHDLVVRRGHELIDITLEVAAASPRTTQAERVDRDIAGIGHWVPLVVDPPVEPDHRVARAMTRAWDSTGELVTLTVFSIVRLVEGRLALSTLGGPLAVLDETSGAIRSGVATYLRLMALVSVNLAVMNLLPIPMLDGGHVLFFVAEAVLRRPLTKRSREYASLAGLVILVLMMVIALENDLERRWPEIRDAIIGTP